MRARRREEKSMNEKMRHVLGFLGLVEDDYGDNSASAAARAFADQPTYDSEPEYSQSPVASSPRPFRAAISNTC